VENLCQATARNVFAEGMLRLIDAGHRVLFSVHDEAVLEVFPGTDPRELERLMGQTPAWLPGCPIAAEATISSRFKK
jgi:DNA polymerase